MSDRPEPPTSTPGLAEVGFYLGTGAFFAFVVVMAVGLSIYGYHRTADAREERVTADAAADASDEGARIYAVRCASCHGAGGEGGVGPGLAGVADRIPDPVEHATIVREGKGQMPAFEGILSDDQIDLVVQFERTDLG